MTCKLRVNSLLAQSLTIRQQEHRHCFYKKKKKKSGWLSHMQLANCNSTLCWVKHPRHRMQHTTTSLSMQHTTTSLSLVAALLSSKISWRGQTRSSRWLPEENWGKTLCRRVFSAWLRDREMDDRLTEWPWRRHGWVSLLFTQMSWFKNPSPSCYCSALVLQIHGFMQRGYLGKSWIFVMQFLKKLYRSWLFVAVGHALIESQYFNNELFDPILDALPDDYQPTSAATNPLDQIFAPDWNVFSGSSDRIRTSCRRHCLCC